ncbi:hypothetical protein IJ00_14050 [Calothrix sp. 336/3]|nr:hypothetical protein IJ00_14050 [Calothrix sp. 336/3]
MILILSKKEVRLRDYFYMKHEPQSDYLCLRFLMSLLQIFSKFKKSNACIEQQETQTKLLYKGFKSVT